MPQDGHCRKWQVGARELSAETNPAKLLELSKELNRALNAQELARKRPGRSGDSDLGPPKIIQANEYERIVEQAVALMGSEYASVQMLFPERGTGGELRLLAFRGFNPQAAQFWEWVRADSKSTCGIALREKNRVVAPDIANCDFMAGSEDQAIYLQTGIHACQTTPVIGHAGNVVGMISTHWQTPHQPSLKELELFEALARQAAELIESCRGEGQSSNRGGLG